MAHSSEVEHCPDKTGVEGSLPSVPTNNPCVAQPGSASALGAEGREFESLHTDQIYGRVAESGLRHRT